MRKRNWLKTTIAMITLIATVLETGFTSVSTLAAEITTEDGIVVNNDAVEEVGEEAGEDLDINVERERGSEDVEDADYEEEEPAEGAAELKEGSLNLSDDGITGSGYDEISIYVDTEGMDLKDLFRLEFDGPASASYNPVINDDLDKTSGGRYDFEILEGGDFSLRATSSDDVTFSYKYNEDGYPTIVVESILAEKILERTTVTRDGEEIEAISGEGFDKITVKFNCEELSDSASYKLYVDSDAEATVDGLDARSGIDGLANDVLSLDIENLDEESFTAYIVSDNDEVKIQSIVDIDSVEDGVAVITVDNINTKRVYEYEDDKVKVTAVLEKADAIPDDAFFCVTPLTEEEAQKYLEALNEGKDEENGDVLATAENTLLYDIGFYKDETKEEEIEPEEGSVSISIEFKKEQLSEEIAAEEDEDIVVTHIVEDGAKITTEEVNPEVSVEDGTVEFTTDSFSLYAIQAIRDIVLEAGETLSYRDVLMGAVNYGLVANTITLANHADTNLATYKLTTGTDNTTQGVYTGKGAPGNNMLAVLDSNKWIPYTPEKKAFTINTTEEVEAQLRSFTDADYWENNNVTINGTMSKTEISGYVSNMVSGTLSSSFATNEKRNPISAAAKFEDNVNKTGKVTIDLTKEAGGTYILDIPAGEIGEGKKYFKEAGWTTIKLKSSQLLVLNIPDTGDVGKIHNFKMIIDDGPGKVKEIGSATSNSSADEFARHLVFNFYGEGVNASLQEVLGVFLAPKGSFYLTGTSTGWAVANHIENGSGEWHCVWQEMDGSTEIPVNKHFINGAGKWENGFRFKLERLNYNNTNEVDTSFKPRYLTLNGNDIDYATGYFELPAKSSSEITWGHNGEWRYAGYTKEYQEWYRITEVDEDGVEIEQSSKKRPNVEYNIIDPAKAYGANQDKENEEPAYDNSKYWFVHVFYYYNPGNNDIITVKKMARTLPSTNCYRGLPCIQDGKIEFKNRYTPNGISVELEAVKKINGSDANIPNDFEFSIYDYLGSNKFSDTAKQTKGNNGKDVKFDPFELKFEGATDWNDEKTEAYFYFLIKETKCPVEYTKDETEYVAKVILKKASNGDLSYEVKYFKFTEKNEEGKIAVDVTKAMSNAPEFKATEGCLFNNKLEKEKTTTINGVKQLVDMTLAAGKYTFTLTSSDDPKFAADYTGSDKYRGASVSTSNDADGNFSFGEMKYTLDDKDKEYTYTIKEEGVVGIDKDGNVLPDGSEGIVKYVMSDDHNVEARTKVQTFKISVADSDNGLIITNPYEAGRAEFKNVYSAKGSISFGVNKEFGMGPNVVALPTNKTFTFVINGGRVKDADGNTVDDEKFSDTVTITYPEKTSDVFKTIEYKDLKKRGTYEYTIKEDVSKVNFVADSTTLGTDGITYDRREYHATVVVTDNGDGTLATACNGAWDKELAATGVYEDPTFINTYDVEPAKAMLEGEKHLSDKAVKAGQFTFDLKSVDKDGNDKDYGSAVVMPVTTVQNGINWDKSETAAAWDKDYFNFGDITFNSEGTYYFAVSERQDVVIDTNGLTEEQIAAEKAKYGFDDTVYIAKIVVSDNGNGKLTVGENYPEYTPSATYGRMRFNNTYNGKGGTHLYAKKIYQYPDLAPDWVKNLKFTFRLTSSDDTKNFSENKKNIEVQNNGEFIDFGLLEYDSSVMVDGSGKPVNDKTFHYTIEEVVEANDGVYYGLDDKFDITKPLAVTNYTDITVKVTRNTETGELTAVPDTNHNAGSQNGTNVIFRNKFDAKGKFTIDGTKKLTGRKFDPADNFRVQLRDPNGQVVALTDNKSNSLNPVKITPTGDFDGEFKFEDIPVDYATIKGWKSTTTENNETVYVFTVEELPGGAAEGKPVTNDPHAIFYVAAKPQYDRTDNEIKVPYEVFRDEALKVPADAISYTNTYTANGETPISTIKSFKNGTLKGNDFEYVLRDEDGNEVKTSNDISGNVNFGLIKYDFDGTVKSVLDGKETTLKAGTAFETQKKQEFTYTVSEKIDASREDVEWPKHADGATEVALFTVKVTVEDKDNGLFDITKVYTDLINNKTYNSEEDFLKNYVIENKYKATGFVYIPATKVFDADVPFPADTFKFILTDGTTSVEKVVGSDKKVSFNNKDNNDPTPGLDMLRFDESDLTVENILYDGKDPAHPTKTYVKYYTMTEWHPADADPVTIKITEGNTEKQIPAYKDSKGYVYDARSYAVMVTLVDNGKGKIETEYFVNEEGTPIVDTSKDNWLVELYKTVRDKVKEIFGADVEGKTIKFINDYESTGSLVLSAKKIMDKFPAGKTLADYGFQFELTGKDENGNDITEIADIDAKGIAVFKKLEYTKASKKDYEYKIREVIPNDPADPDKTAVLDETTGKYVLDGVYYDPAVYTVKVTVSENTAGADGHLTTAYVVTKDNNSYTPSIVEVTVDGETVKDAVQVDFTNVYDVKPIEIRLGGLKEILGRDLTAADKFEFTMESKQVAGDGYGYKEYKDKQTNDEKGLFEFKPLTFELNDLYDEKTKTYAAKKTFVYEVNELVPTNDNDKIAGVTYVNTPHTIEITVENTPDAKDATGKLTYSITSDDGVNKVPVVYPVAEGSKEAQLQITYAIAARFNNKFQADGNLILPVKKIIEEAPNDPNKTFDFELKGINGTVINGSDGKPVADNKLVVTGVKSNETKNFDAIHYDFKELKKEGNVYKKEYDYEVTETSKSTGADDPYTYSEEVYTVHVTVETDGSTSVLSEENGSIKYDITYKETPDATAAAYKDGAMLFKNHFKAEGSVPIEIIKKMVNKPLDTDQFSFKLVEVDENGNAISDEIPVNKSGAGTLKWETVAGSTTPASGMIATKLPIAVSEFLGATLKYDLNDLKDGDTYKTEAVKHYTLEEVQNNGKGVICSTAIYDIEVTIKNDYSGKLDVQKTVKLRDGSVSNAVVVNPKDSKPSPVEWFKRFIGLGAADADATSVEVAEEIRKAREGKALFVNVYDSKCVIDPPILYKQMVGKELERGDFTFLLEGPGLRSMAEDPTAKNAEGKLNGHSVYTQNGKTPEGSIYYPDGRGEIPVDEIYVGEIQYTFNDLIDFALDDDAKLATIKPGDKLERTFEYYAKEVAPDKREDGMDYSLEDFVKEYGRQPQEYLLRVRVVDDGEGGLHVYNANGEEVDFVNTHFFWEPVSKYALSDEEMNDTFLNRYNREGSITIPGIKEMVGRELTKDDKFQFKITDITPESPYKGQSAFTENFAGAQYNPDGALNTIEFRPEGDDKIAGTDDDIPFLTFREGAFVKNEAEVKADPNVAVELEEVDDTKYIHEYLIEETDKYDGKYEGVTRRNDKFKVKVKVSRDGDIVNKKGHLKAEILGVYVVKESGTDELFDPSKFVFKNDFKASNKISISGKKYVEYADGSALESKESLLNQYEFTVYQYTDETRKEKARGPVATTLTDADGNFTLDIPEYTQEVLKRKDGKYDNTKTLYYQIVETKPSEGTWSENNTLFESEGVIYDLNSYDMDVVVSYDGTTTLKVEKKIVDNKTKAAIRLTEPNTKKDKDEEIEFIKFTNKVKKYKVIEGNKYWIDNIKDPKDRPTVTVNLYRRTASGVETKINSYDIVAPDTTYRFNTDSAGNKLAVTDSAGRPYKYIVEETPIEGYLSEKVNYDFYNTKEDILIRKIDAETRTTLSGATLAILDGSKEIERWTSDVSAHVVESALTAGKTYTLHEISAPEGYGVADDMTFTVPSDGSGITVTMSDPPIIGSVRLTKVDASTRETLAGAEFALYNEAGTRIYATGSAGSYRATSTTSNGVFITDGSGSLTISDLPYGTYYFVETKAPDGYALSSERLGFTILRGGELVEVTYVNTKAVGSVRLRKVGSTGSRGLAGAVFELYAATPRSIGQAASSTIFSDAYYRYGTYRTNAAGEIYVGDLPWDDYYFVEVDAPDGYEIMTDVNGDDLAYTFRIDASSTDRTIELGDIINNPEEETPPPRGGVLGERVKRGGVVNGVLGVRAKPNSGVLGERIGPVTGDASNIILWSLLLAACVATIVATVLTGRKKKAAK